MGAYNNYYFNVVQQPVNMITGYQRQHRKSITFTSIYGADPDTTDQYTRLITNASNQSGLHETFSKACELATISGMCLLQPYLDFTTTDPAQGEIKVKLWEYNSFVVDPFFRNPDMSDAQFVWCQQFLTREQAEIDFPRCKEMIQRSTTAPNKYGEFYFLPENYSISKYNFVIVSYVWYKATRKRKKLYSRKLNQFFDYKQDNPLLQQIMQSVNDFELVELTVPTWKLAIVLNDNLAFHGNNPLDFDECPFIPVFWNYDPHINTYNYRVRSLVRPMRDPQFLFNHKVISNNDIAAATINSGWKRKVGAVANEDNLKKASSGYDVIVNEGYEMTDVEKIIPNAVPQSDLELANQMYELMYSTSGINLENWSGQTDKQISSLTMMMKQAANLTVFQKYFDQWDFSLKQLGEVTLKIALNNWNKVKVGMCINEEPTAVFYSNIFVNYHTVVEEGILTPTQKNMQAQQMMDINQAFGREVFPPSFVIKDMNIQGKREALEFLKQQEQAQQQMQQDQAMVAHAIEDAKLKELYSRATANIATARERHGRAESNIGLFEERLSEISRNRALATKDKMDALEKLVDVIAKYGEIETALNMQKINSIQIQQEVEEDREKVDAKQTSLANDFQQQLMGNMQSPQMGIDNQQNFE